jgi:hypothetical protein
MGMTQPPVAAATLRLGFYLEHDRDAVPAGERAGDKPRASAHIALSHHSPQRAGTDSSRRLVQDFAALLGLLFAH